MLINDVFYLLDSTLSNLFPEITKDLLLKKRNIDQLIKEKRKWNFQKKI